MNDSTSNANSDTFLQMLVGMANVGSIEIKVILNVGGIIVAGRLISGSKYFSGIARRSTESIIRYGKEADAEWWNKTILDLGGDYFDLTDKMREAVQSNTSPNLDQHELHPPYLHLEDVEMHMAGASIKVSWWRGRLAQIDGWTFAE